jgi:hypothetical protein
MIKLEIANAYYTLDGRTRRALAASLKTKGFPPKIRGCPPKLWGYSPKLWGYRNDTHIVLLSDVLLGDLSFYLEQ